MAPEPIRAAAARCAAAAILALAAAPPAHALRVLDYNLTNYPSVLIPARQPYFRTVVGAIGPDVIIAEELLSQAGVDSFRTNVLNVLEPGQWASAPFADGNDTNNALFYKPARVQLLGTWAFYPNPATNLRLVHVFRLEPAGYASGAAEFRIYGVHLKASSGSTNETARYDEAIGIRDSMNAAPPGTAMLLCGDYNVYTSDEPAYVHFLESEANDTGRLFDPIQQPGAWHNAAAYAPIHTQCPCNTCPSGSGFSGGGLDDRFDFLLATGNLLDGQGLDVLPGTYRVVGNDGLHFNLNITDLPTIPEGAEYANALWNASDHLPVRVDLQLPPVGGAPAALAFGTVVTGATATRTLAVTNASAPLDSLDLLRYTLAASAGFTAPSGALSVAEGLSSSDAIGMDSSTPGPKSGTVTVSSNDPDHPTLVVSLSGDVLRHAAASLDSLAPVTATTLDFGTHAADEFEPLDVRVHDRGWDAQQARLALSGAAFSGGAGRFSLAAGATPQLLAGVGATFSVAFDATGATADSTYTATLAFTSADEALPGATSQPELAVTLRANVASGGTTGVDGASPTATMLYAPFPNPLAAGATLRFDVARAGQVRLDVFDPSGRRVARLAAGARGPGRYSVRWDGRDDGGAPAGAGLYFVRFSAPGVKAQTARLAIVR